MVYVLDVQEKPLMPTKDSKAAYLLKSGKAKVKFRTPFTIQLLYATKTYTQPITAGLDPGYGWIGFSAVTEQKELISGVYQLENKMSSRLKERANYRKYRRYHLRYRKQRNRNRRIPLGWMAPSLKHRLRLHVNLITFIKSILPVTHTILEIANFDVKKIIQEDKAVVLRTNNQTFNNLLSYLISRENSKCQFCKKEQGADTWNAILIDPNNLTPVSINWALVHSACKVKIEAGQLHKKIQKSKSYSAEVFMNTVRWKLLDQIENSSYTFGYITYQKRQEFNLDKEHYTDAYIIASGSTQERSVPFEVHYHRSHSRQLQLNRKGYAPAIRRNYYKMKPGDEVKYKGKIYLVKGVHSYGRRINLYDNEGNILTKQVGDVKLVKYAKTLTFTKGKLNGTKISKF